MDINTLYDLADPRIKGIWDEKNTQYTNRLEYTNLGFSDESAEILEPKFENFSGLGLAQPTNEGEAYSQEDIVQGYQVTIGPEKFTKAISIKEEFIRFNLWPKIGNLVGGVSNSLNGRIDVNAAKIYYLGFGTTFFTGGDSLALYSDSHTMKEAATQDNDLDTVQLTYDNLKTAVQKMDRFYDDKGIQLQPCSSLRLIVAREKKEKAEEILRSIGNPDSANRVNNVFNNGTGFMDYRVANKIPSSTYGTYWYVIDLERANLMTKAVWGWKPRFDDDKVINTGSKVYTGSTMFKFGFQSWQWTCGSASTT